MSTRKTFAGLLRGILAKYLKEALVYLKNPKKLSRLLTAVIVYTSKNIFEGHSPSLGNTERLVQRRV